MKIDKTKMKGPGGQMITQGLFIDFNYDDTYAMFTWDDEDKMYNGKLYPSLKKLYLSSEDPTEYEFANKYLLGWRHWQRMQGNKTLKEQFDEWREELDVMLRSLGVRQMLDMAEDNFQAAKYLADRGWNKQSVGRPSKKQQEIETKIKSGLSSFDGDITLLSDYKDKKHGN